MAVNLLLNTQSTGHKSYGPMTFEARNLFGHTYSHGEVFAASKKKAWRPKHHELAFGKAVTRPPWYRNVSYGGESGLPSPVAGRRYDPKETDLPPGSGKFSEVLQHFTGESRHDIMHGSSVFAGPHERELSQRMNEANVAQHHESAVLRAANTAVHDGREVHALVRRENTSKTQQPLYPVSVVNDSFHRHLEAKAIDSSSRPKSRDAQREHPTQRMYLPYERTRRSVESVICALCFPPISRRMVSHSPPPPPPQGLSLRWQRRTSARPGPRHRAVLVAGPGRQRRRSPWPATSAQVNHEPTDTYHSVHSLLRSIGWRLRATCSYYLQCRLLCAGLRRGCPRPFRARRRLPLVSWSTRATSPSRGRRAFREDAAVLVNYGHGFVAKLKDLCCARGKGGKHARGLLCR